MYESFSKATKSFQSFSADPDMTALMDERSASPSADMKGPNVYRMAYGVPSNPPRPIMAQRMYHMPRKNLASALELAPELDELMKSQDVSIGVAVPIATDDHEMMVVVYRFNSMDHYGEALDAMVENKEMAASFGIYSSRVYAVTFAIGAGLAGVAGALFGAYNIVLPTMGMSYVVEAFMMVVSGGGGIMGTLLASVLAGEIQSVFAWMINDTFARGILYGLIVVLLRFRPQGLISSSTSRR